MIPARNVCINCKFFAFFTVILIRSNTYSLLVLNITFRTTPDDLFPLFDKYGKVVDIFIPRDRRTGESRGFAFVRYKYADEAQKAVDRLDGRVVDGREMAVQFAKYGQNAEKIRLSLRKSTLLS
ncbi:serine/arginine-rich splicing factor SC35-like [Spinacia oleracea]|uniref:Serine/arginine-rich splicing factor SC35-like n=1 Tax=Spinacia oleracea TaxID=3562 RepID=A0A9R0KCJ0_SPIOL|nr:serine/arginine-rich splicing factor SC35-like [Spinacia oleracea]